MITRTSHFVPTAALHPIPFQYSPTFSSIATMPKVLHMYPNISHNSRAAYATTYTACSFIYVPHKLSIKTPLVLGALGTHIRSNQVNQRVHVYGLHSTKTQLVCARTAKVPNKCPSSFNNSLILISFDWRLAGGLYCHVRLSLARLCILPCLFLTGSVVPASQRVGEAGGKKPNSTCDRE
jgi:hypothetical protein